MGMGGGDRVQRIMRYVDRDNAALAIACREQICEKQRRAAVAGSRFEHSVQVVLKNDFLIVPHIERELRRAYAAIGQILPDVGAVEPLEILLSFRNHRVL